MGPGFRRDDREESDPMTKPLASRIALVTGASRGIGYATARALARQGAHIVAVSRAPGGPGGVCDQIRKHRGRVPLLPLNRPLLRGHARLGAPLPYRHPQHLILS